MTARKVIITMADGTEKDVTDKSLSMNAAMFARIVAVTKAAGRMLPVSYRIEEVAVALELDAETEELVEYERHYASVKKAMSY